MPEHDDIWQRYDAKVVQLRVADEKIGELTEQLEAMREERDRWATTCALLTQKLAVARTLAERLRSVEKGGRGRRHTTDHGRGREDVERAREESERAREVIGLMLSALAGAWSGREQAWKASTSNGGRLLFALTRGAMASVSIEDHQVESEWLRGLDLDRLRAELGFGGGNEIEVEFEVPVPEPEMEPEPEYQGRGPLPPPPSFRTGAEPPLISALDPYDEPEYEAPARPSLPVMPTRSSSQATVVKPVPPPPFQIGKLVKPTT